MRRLLGALLIAAWPASAQVAMVGAPCKITDGSCAGTFARLPPPSGCTTGSMATFLGSLTCVPGLTYAGGVLSVPGAVRAQNFTAIPLPAAGAVTVTPKLSQLGGITVVAGSALADGDGLSVGDGVGVVPIEFDAAPGDGTTGGAVAIVFDGSETATQIRDAVKAILDGAGRDWTTSAQAANGIGLVRATPGATGGAITEDVTAAGFSVTDWTPPTAATTYTYSLQACAADGKCTAAGAASSTAAGVLTLSAYNPNRLSWSTVSGAALYKVRRDVGGATQGVIWSGTALTVDDTGLAGDSTAKPTVDGTGVVTAEGGLAGNGTALTLGHPAVTVTEATGAVAVPKLTATVHSTPAQLGAITQGGTAGGTTYSYSIATLAPDGTTSPASTARNTFTGNATLSGSNYNILPIPAVVANSAGYRVYRASGGATQGAIGDTTEATFNDTGLAASGSIPTLNTTGPISGGTLDLSGNGFFRGRVGIGSTSGGAQTDHTLYVYDTNASTSGTRIGFGAYMATSPSSASSSNKYGFIAEMLAGGTQNHTGALAASFVKAQSNSSGTTSSLTGVRIETKNLTGAGTISAAKAIDVHVYTTTATMTEGWGYFGNTPLVLGAGAITKFTHIYLNDSTAAGTNYGLISPSTTMRNGIGTAAPDALLHVHGSVSFSNLPVYADNAAALAGGLVAGNVYRTSTGVLMVTY